MRLWVLRRARRLGLMLLTGLCLAAACASARAGEADGAKVATDITSRCNITVSHNQQGLANMLNDDPRSYWEALYDSAELFVQVDAPQDAPIYGLYIVWAYEPEPWLLSAPNPERERYLYLEDDDPLAAPHWAPILTGGGNRYAHEYVALDGLTSLRIQANRLTEHPFAIESLHVLGEGTLPDWVQNWQPIPDRVDLMVVSTHADDELIFLGGTLPTYAGERGLDTAVIYMTYCARYRRSELLNGLWAAGVHAYPVLGDFIDNYFPSSRDLAAISWGEEAVGAFLTEQLRRYKPKVVVTQDLEGEYGHGMHRLTAQKTLEAVTDLAWDDTCFPESAAAYGVWDVDKLYLHLYPKDRVRINWRTPLARFGGSTALDVAAQAFDAHISQQPTYQLRDWGKTDCSMFGLAYTMVGPDEAKDDFFEHVILWRDEEAEQ